MRKINFIICQESMMDKNELSDIILDAVIIVAMVIYLIIHLKEYLANIETRHNIEK